MSSEATFAMIIAGLGLAWCVRVSFYAPLALAGALAGDIALAARMASVTAAALTVIVVMPWPAGGVHESVSAAVLLDPWCAGFAAVRVVVAVGLTVFLAAAAPVLMVGARARMKLKEQNA